MCGVGQTQAFRIHPIGGGCASSSLPFCRCGVRAFGRLMELAFESEPVPPHQSIRSCSSRSPNPDSSNNDAIFTHSAHARLARAASCCAAAETNCAKRR
jgi:hypothetical protein